MNRLAKLIEALSQSFTARPPVPCCASGIHWAGFR